MPLFPQPYLFPQASLLQILSELEQPQPKACVTRHTKSQTFTPRFDVTEVAQAYELYGELPGVEQEDISINFTDAQTLVINGKTDRASSHTLAAETTQHESTKDSETASDKPRNPTVEDEYDEADTPLTAPASTSTVTESNAAAEQQDETETPTSKPKFWAAERRVGSFARSFSFSQRIEQDGVKASLKNGILHVVVPKSQKSGRVAVSIF